MWGNACVCFPKTGGGGWSLTACMKMPVYKVAHWLSLTLWDFNLSMRSKILAKVCALVFIIEKQKQKMASNEGIVQLLLSTFQPSKSHVIRDNLLTFPQNVVKKWTKKEQCLTYIKSWIQAVIYNTIPKINMYFFL